MVSSAFGTWRGNNRRVTKNHVLETHFGFYVVTLVGCGEYNSTVDLPQIFIPNMRRMHFEIIQVSFSVECMREFSQSVEITRVFRPQRRKMKTLQDCRLLCTAEFRKLLNSSSISRKRRHIFRHVSCGKEILCTNTHQLKWTNGSVIPDVNDKSKCKQRIRIKRPEWHHGSFNPDFNTFSWIIHFSRWWMRKFASVFAMKDDSVRSVDVGP